MVDASSHRPDHERSDASAALIAVLAAGLAIFLIASPYILLWIYPASTDNPKTTQLAAAPPSPRLQVDPAADFQAFRHDENDRLATYGWADRDAGVVRIPIERAKELTAQRGLPGWPQP